MHQLGYAVGYSRISLLLDSKTSVWDSGLSTTEVSKTLSYDYMISRFAKCIYMCPLTCQTQYAVNLITANLVMCLRWFVSSVMAAIMLPAVQIRVVHVGWKQMHLARGVSEIRHHPVSLRRSVHENHSSLCAGSHFHTEAFVCRSALSKPRA